MWGSKLRALYHLFLHLNYLYTPSILALLWEVFFWEFPIFFFPKIFQVSCISKAVESRFTRTLKPPGRSISSGCSYSSSVSERWHRATTRPGTAGSYQAVKLVVWRIVSLWCGQDCHHLWLLQPGAQGCPTIPASVSQDWVCDWGEQHHDFQGHSPSIGCLLCRSWTTSYSHIICSQVG